MKINLLALVALGLELVQAGTNSTTAATSDIEGKDWREIPPGQEPGKQDIQIPDDEKDLPKSPPYYPSPEAGRFKSSDYKWVNAVQRASDFVGRLTLVEKVNLTTGLGMNAGKCSGTTGSVPRFNIPEICVNNGPLGVGDADLVSSFPPGLSVGTSFNKELAKLRGKAIGKEFRAKEAPVCLGPCVGPLSALGGRGWESFGYDPYLDGIMGGVTVEYLQNEGVMANIKHFIGYEQEKYRNIDMSESFGYGTLHSTISSNIDDRTLHELYMWPFADAIHAGAASVMCSYNQLNNTPVSENSMVLSGLLKDELGFQGFVMTDWFSASDGTGAVLGGLDMLMPGSAGSGDADSSYSIFGANLTTMVLNGTVPVERVDDMATRIMAAYYYVGLDSWLETGYEGPNFSSRTKQDYGYLYGDQQYTLVNKRVNAITKLSKYVAKQGALESFVLVKNENNTLPLKQRENKLPKTMGVFGLGAFPNPDGTNCDSQMCSNGAMATGWGSGAVRYPYLLTPFESLNQRGIDEGISVAGTTGNEVLWTDDYNTTEYYNIATTSDVNVVFGLTDSGEEFGLVANNSFGDRWNYTLWHAADELIEKTIKLNKNNIIVVSTVGPVDLERWIDHENVTAVLINTPTGQDFGPAVSDILFGDENPSGKLPFTIARNTSDYSKLLKNWPNNSNIAPQDDFTDGLYIDYRRFDKMDLKPRYEFGYGLSYSNWTFSDLEILEWTVPPETFNKSASYLPPVRGNNSNSYGDVEVPSGFNRIKGLFYPWVESKDDIKKGKFDNYPEGYSDVPRNESAFPHASGDVGGNPQLWETAFKVRAKVHNQGPYRGKYVAQLYLTFPESDEFPTPKVQLRGFEKVDSANGEDKVVEFNIRARDLAVWDVKSQGWKVQRGKYTAHVGHSSRHLETSKDFEIS